MSARDTVSPTNPFPGLRAFRENEEHLFFGREKQVDGMVDKLAETHFLAVVGTSGSGKSSLVNCGLRPALYRGWMPKAGTVWRMAQFRPGSNPIRAMAEALSRDGVLYEGFKSDDFSLAEIIESGLRTSKLGLISAFEQARLGADVNLLVVADQFEELFRYHKVGTPGSEAAYGLGEDAKAFVKLLLEVCEHKSLPVYVVLTMRSDFLGDCAQFLGLPEAINAGQYLVPRMSRDERRLAIVGPVGVGGAQIDPALATRLVNDVGDNPDQLSILQHALNRTWARWEEDGHQGHLELKHYEAIGTMAHALDQHAERAFSVLDTERKQKVCERIMKALTDWGTDARGTRRPTKLGTLCALADATQAEVIEVIDVFRKPSRSFLMPPIQATLDVETVIDISHESLMRVWERLKTWGEEEAKSAQLYRRLRDWALRWSKGEAELWRGPDLASAIAWREREAPGAQWAERYGSRDDHQLALRFLDASEQAQRAEVAAAEAKRRGQLRRARRWAWGSGTVTLTLLVGLLGYFAAFVWNRSAYFNSYVKVFGVPRGIGRLTAEQIKHRALSYKITTKGLYGPVMSMDAVNATGHFATGGMTTGFETSSGDRAEREVRWEYGYAREGRVLYEVSLDPSGQRVRSTIYSPTDKKTPQTRSAYLIGKAGSMAPPVGSCVASLRYEYSKDGYESQTHFLDQSGELTVGRDGVSILETEFDRLGNRTRLLSRWTDKRPMIDRFGDADTRVSYDDLGNVIREEMLDAAEAPINVKRMDWQLQTRKYDVYGNLAEQVFGKADGSPGLGEDGCHRLRHTLDERGNVVRSDCLDQEGRPALAYRESHAAWEYAAWEYHYDGKGRLADVTYYDLNRQPAKGQAGAFRVALGYDRDDNMASVAYFSADGRPTVGRSGFHKQSSTFENGLAVLTEYAGVDGKPVEREGGYVAIERKYDWRGNEKRLAYLGSGHKPVHNGREGFAITEASYDECGRETRRAYLNGEEKLIRAAKRYAVKRTVYDNANHVVDETYMDEARKLTLSVDRYAHVKRKLDRHGNVIEETRFDEGDKPILINGLYATRVLRYDGHNALVEELYLGASGDRVANEKGWTRISYVRNADGQSIETSYFGEGGKRVMLEKRCAKTNSRKNDRDALVEEAYLGAGGEPVPKIETVYFGPDDKPVTVERSYARLTRTYDDQRGMFEESYFGVGGEPVPVKLTLSVGRDGKPVMRSKGYAKMTGRLDARNALLEEAYFGPGGEPVLNEEGWARITYVYDERGRMIERAHFGVRGEPVVGKNARYHQARWVLDEQGNWVEVAIFGTDGKPLAIALAGGTRRCARFVRRYDANGEETWDCFDEVGKRVQ